MLLMSVQGLIKLMEPEVWVRGKKEDEKIIE